MVCHKAIDMYQGIITSGCRFQIGEKLFSVTLAFKYIFPFISSGYDILNGLAIVAPLTIKQFAVFLCQINETVKSVALTP